jgi:hypothetical protein
MGSSEGPESTPPSQGLRRIQLQRLDRVPAAKTVAQIGVEIGRSFSYELRTCSC